MTNSTHVMLESKYEKLIDMEVESKSGPLENARDRRDRYQREAAALKKLREHLKLLRQTAKDLFGFRSPFNVLKGYGDNIDRYFDITAKKTAEQGEHTIEILSVAKNQRFSTDPVNKHKMLAEGEFTVKVGGKTKTVDFGGGTIHAFMGFMREQFAGSMKLTLIQHDKNSQVLVFSVIDPGKENEFKLIEDKSGIFDELGVFKKEYPVFLDYGFSKHKEHDIKIENDRGGMHEFVRELLIIKDERELSLSLDKSAKLQDGLKLEFSVKSVKRKPAVTNTVVKEEKPKEETGKTKALNSPGLDIADVGGVNFGGMELDGEFILPYQTGLYRPEVVEEPVIEPKEEEEFKFNNNIIGVYYEDQKGRKKIKYIPVENLSDIWEHVSIDLEDHLEKGDKVIEVVFANKNPGYDISYRNVLVHNDKDMKKNIKNELQEASSVHILLDGIEVISDGNKIEGKIEGVELSVKRPTDEPIEFMLNPDNDMVIDRIYNFVYAYNQVMLFLYDATSMPISKEMLNGIHDMSLSQLMDLADRMAVDYHADIMPNELRSRLLMRGIFKGDLTINNMKQKLKFIVAAPYPTSYERELALLSQIGISQGEAGSGWTSTQKGTLTVNEDELKSKLEQYLDGVGELFGRDVSEDGRIDSGIAYEIDKTVAYYSRTRGIIDSLITSAETRVEGEQKTIEDEQDDLNDLRAKLQRKYARMNAEIKAMESQQKRLQNGLKGISGN